MKIGFVGLGKMGGNIVRRLLVGHDAVVWNRSNGPVEEAVKHGATAADNIEDLVLKLDGKKIVWMMLPAGDVTEKIFQDLLGMLNSGDIIIDGANSNFHDTNRRHIDAGAKGIDMLDVGVSGGIIAADTGYPMMVGGKQDVYDYIKPIFDTIGIKDGYGLVGGPAAGHYVKMVHNAIEYGMMQSIAEGFDLLENGSVKELDLQKISKVWSNGTIIAGLLMDMVRNSLERDSKIELKPYVNDSGEGRWAAEDALAHSVPFVANTYALHARYISRQKNSLAFRMLAAMRREFGGHAVKK